MPFFEGAHDFNIKGGSFNDVSGNMTINDTSRRNTNYGSYNTTNRTYDNSTNDYRPATTKHIYQGPVGVVGTAETVNNGTNQDYRGTFPSPHYDKYAQRGYDYLRSRGQGSRPPYLHAQSVPAGMPHYEPQEPQYYGHPPHQPPYPYSPRGFPPGNPYGVPPQGHNPYPPGMHAMDAEHANILGEAMEELRMEGRYHSDSDGEDDDDLNPRVERMKSNEPVPLSAAGFTPATFPRVRSDLVASAPPTIAPSTASAQSVSPPMKSNNPFRSGAFTDRS
ncbi:hypothetical protein K443DRAFT_6334 [Laccaria amethystina LaAM-08-1]|jgi:hypothetical protein|uniref:Uncharacterized protein n=1 Tax=Laccaria amethystina LaAM-08-1 TaxID=1095629 RepID=A0A0C9XKV9_9AGAR|nr:hypothetical protein K443DRAFT_6334 [Laccaria amethystina LaAM-08-1]